MIGKLRSMLHYRTESRKNRESEAGLHLPGLSEFFESLPVKGERPIFDEITFIAGKREDGSPIPRRR